MTRALNFIQTIIMEMYKLMTQKKIKRIKFLIYTLNSIILIIVKNDNEREW